MNFRKKLIIIFGPEASGKMTIGRELANLLDYNLVVQEDIDHLVRTILKGRSVQVSAKVTTEIFKGFASIQPKGIIYTLPWDFSSSRDRLRINQCIRDCLVMSCNTYYVELDASLETRLFRNTTDLRLAYKPSKRDASKSEKLLLIMENTGQYRSDPEEFSSKKNYLYINTEKFSAAEAAYEIVDKFKLLQY